MHYHELKERTDCKQHKIHDLPNIPCNKIASLSDCFTKKFGKIKESENSGNWYIQVNEPIQDDLQVSLYF